MPELSEKIIKEIGEKKICPTPKWCFTVRDYGLFILFAVLIIVGAFAVATIIFMIVDYDWSAYRYLGQSRFESVLMALPYLWLIILGIFAYFAYSDLRHTKTGYRLEAPLLILISIISSTLLGTVIYSRGFDSELHELMACQIPAYHYLTYDRKDEWNNPDQGLLAGQISGINSADEFRLVDFHGRPWIIIIRACCFDQNLIRKDNRIKMIGERALVDEYDRFIANEIYPWR